MTKQEFKSKCNFTPISKVYRLYRTYCRVVQEYTGSMPYWADWTPGDPRLVKFAQIIPIAKDMGISPKVFFEFHVYQSLVENKRPFAPEDIYYASSIERMVRGFENVSKIRKGGSPGNFTDSSNEQYELSQINALWSTCQSICKRTNANNWKDLFVLPSVSESYMANLDANGQVPDSFKLLCQQYRDWDFATSIPKNVTLTKRIKQRFENLFS